MPSDGSLLKLDDREMELKIKNKGIPSTIGSYNKPSDHLAELYEKADDFLQIEDDLGGKRPFSREDLRYIINKTYLEFYGKFKDQFNPDEYMQVVDEEEIVKRFGHALEHNEDNLLTKWTIPYLDLGDIPSTHTFMRTESEQ